MKLPMQIAAALVAGALILPLAGGCAGDDSDDAAPPSAAPPYESLQDRRIRAVSPQRVADLLAGRGAGYALAAELNHYPGPRHVLALREQLRLGAGQERAVRAVERAMAKKAKRLGAKLVEMEGQLDRAFRHRHATRPVVTRLTAAIAALEGQLRFTHLEAHLRVARVLSPAQVARYDRLRGYTTRGDATALHTDGEDPGRQHGR